MTHMVIFRSPEGKPGYHQSEGLDEAMRFAEMLRNQEQVTDARIFRMDEVPIEFKTYYRVEMVAESADQTAASTPLTESSVAETPEVETVVAKSPQDAAEDTPDSGTDEQVEGAAPGEQAELEPVEAGARGSVRHGLFTRG